MVAYTFCNYVRFKTKIFSRLLDFFDSKSKIQTLSKHLEEAIRVKIEAQGPSFCNLITLEDIIMGYKQYKNLFNCLQFID